MANPCKMVGLMKPYIFRPLKDFFEIRSRLDRQTCGHYAVFLGVKVYQELLVAIIFLWKILKLLD